MNELAGAGVLVTRPEHQAGPLCALIEARGGCAVRFATIVIEPAAEPQAVRDSVGALGDYDWAIFVSANAVHFALQTFAEWPAGLRCAAVGAATAQQLSQAIGRAVLAPSAASSSEGLLAEPALRDMQGRRVLIVRAQHGRELLGDVLRQRGADVRHAAVYSRHCAPLDRARRDRLEADWSGGAIDYVTAGSVETLRCLGELLSPRGRALLVRSVLVSASDRVIIEATELGIEQTLRAIRPDDSALIDAIAAHCCRA